MKKSVKRLVTCLCVAAVAVAGTLGAVQTGRLGQSSSRPVILLDAGHGGFDGGAVAGDGTAEKDINLAITLKLDALLRAMGFTTKLIRSEDTSVESEGSSVRERKRSDIVNRFAMMEENPGCLYLCLHQNFFSGASSHCAQIFYTAQNADAKALATALQEAIVADLQPDNHRQIKPCTKDVYLIYHAKETAVLIECGFLSNAGDLANLKDDIYQSKMAFAICDGLIQYLNGRDKP